MSLLYQDLKLSISADWLTMSIPSMHLHELDQTAQKLLHDKYAYDALEKRTGVPAVVSMVISERESGGNLNCSLAQGDPWRKVSVHVPAGLGPYLTWIDAAADAFRLDGLDKVGAGNWEIEHAIFFWERFNGWGYRRMGLHSPYVWGMSNHQDRGKYIRDGYFDRNTWDDQPGCASLAARLIFADSTLSKPLQNFQPNAACLMQMPVAPTTAQIQTALNKRGYGLTVDNQYGPATRLAVRDFQSKMAIAETGICDFNTWKLLNT